MRTLIASLALVLCASQAFADSMLVRYNPVGPQDSRLPGVPVPPDANSFSASPLSTTFSGSVNTHSLPVGVIPTSATIDTAQYLQFALQGPASVTRIVYSYSRFSAGPATVSVRSSNDGFASDLVTVVAPNNLFGSDLTLTLPNLPVTPAGTTFRIYIYNAPTVDSFMDVLSTAASGGGTGLRIFGDVPAISKSFGTSPVAVNGTSILSFFINNPTSTTLTNVAFSDTLPGALVVAAAPATSNGCGGTLTATPATNAISLTGATAGAFGVCVITVPVTSPTSGPVTNTTGPLTSTQSNLGSTATAILLVASPVETVKSFLPAALPVNGTSTMTIQLYNPNSFSLSGISITDNYPAGLASVTFGSTTLCGGTLTVAATSVSLTGAAIPPAAVCVINVNVTASAAGPYTNTTGSSTTATGVVGPGATATVRFTTPPTITKLFSATQLVLGQTANMTITLTNPNAAALSGVAFTDTFPAGLVPSNIGGSCGGTKTLNGQLLTVTGVPLTADPDASHQCTVTATVTAAQVGSWTNTTGTVSSTDPAMTGLASNPAAILVLGPPTLSKAFNPSTIAIAGTSVITFTITNPNPTLPVTNIAFTDSLPPGVIVSQTPNVTSSCSSLVTAVPNSTSISLTGGSVLAGAAPCEIQVTVQGTTPGTKVNTTSNITGVVSTQPVTGDPATATLLVTESQVSFLIRYAANLNVGESFVNFTNTGESSTSSFGAGTFAQNGEICANVFAYSPDEQLVSCCSCNVTPNALNSLSVKADLGTNTLTPIIPSSLVIKVVATQGGTACSAASASTVNTAVLQPGLAAWGTSLHALPVAGGTGAGTFGVAETPFSLGTITPAELQRMAQLCAFIRANGSGYGICKSCKVGGLGAASK